MHESPRMPQEQIEKNEAEFARFREEIARLKAEEKGTVHLRDIQPEELMEEDAYIYQCFLDDTLDPNIFETYRNSMQEKGSRADFAAYLGNMIMIKNFQHYLSDPEKENT